MQGVDRVMWTVVSQTMGTEGPCGPKESGSNAGCEPGDVDNGVPDTVGTVGPYGPKESGSNAGC